MKLPNMENEPRPPRSSAEFVDTDGKLSADAPIFVPASRNENRSPTSMIVDDFGHRSTTTPPNDSTTTTTGMEVDETDGDGGWTTATQQNRRRRTPKTFANENLRQHQSQATNNGRLPGEAITIDGFHRFVVWSTEYDVIERSLEQGRLALVLMRGVPGSGKSTMAEKLSSNGVICSADQYFGLLEDNSYHFDKTRLDDAHAWCLQRATQSMCNLVSPVIVDNTNVRLWEMARYVKVAIRNNYDVYFLEPNTEWKWNATECARRNKHKVPYETIERMTHQFENVNTLRVFLESGLLKQPTRPPVVAATTEPAQPIVSDVVSIPSRCSSSSDVIEMKEQDVTRTLRDDWAASDSSWAMDDQPRDEAAPAPPTVPPGFQASSLSKEQRSARLDAAIAVNSPKVQEAAKKSETPTRARRRPDGYGLDFGLGTAGAWKLPTDLVGGLAGVDRTIGEDVFSIGEKQVRVRDATTQVSEKHLALSGLQHRRLSRQSVDECEIDAEERTIKKLERQMVAMCDRSVQCENDVNNAEEDVGAKAIATLRSFFPQVNSDDIEEIFNGCGGDLEWSVNVLLDSGYDVDMQSKASDVDREISPIVGNVKEPSVAPSQPKPIVKESIPNSSEAKSKARNLDHSPWRQTEMRRPHTSSDAASSDLESVVYTTELSIDAVKLLQNLFPPIFADIPPDLLSPQQLKIRFPQELLADIYRCWLETQTNASGSEGDSDFFSEESMSDEFASPGQEGTSGAWFGKYSADYEEDNVAIEQQILADEELARRLAAEEDGDMPRTLIESEYKPAADGTSMASQLRLRRLQELFPAVDRPALKNIFAANNYDLDQTIDILSESFNIPKGELTGSSSVGRGYAVRAAQKPPATREEAVDERSERSGRELTYHELRQEASVHFEERQANYQKAQDYYRRGMTDVAYYYAQRGHLHNLKFKEANGRAASKILQQRKAANPDGVLDLHGLHVTEAIRALVDVLREHNGRPGKEIKIITGQGLHSAKGPKIKPAVEHYLRNHGYTFTRSTPGVLVVTIK